MKKIICIGWVAVLLCMSVLIGCRSRVSHTFIPTSSSIYVMRDGTIQSAIVEMIGEVSISDVGLLEFAQEEVDSYNTQVASEVVRVEKAEVADGKAMIIYEYADVETMTTFATLTDNTSIDLEILEVSAITKGQEGISTFTFPASYTGAYVALIDTNILTQFVFEGDITYVEGEHISYTGNVANVEGSGYILFE